MQQLNEDLQKLTLEGQKRLNMSGVDSVDGFSEQLLKLTVGGSKVIVSGNGIKITAYSKGTGNLTADGKITYIKYDYKKAPFLKRVFK